MFIIGQSFSLVNNIFQSFEPSFEPSPEPSFQAGSEHQTRRVPVSADPVEAGGAAAPPAHDPEWTRTAPPTVVLVQAGCGSSSRDQDKANKRIRPPRGSAAHPFDPVFVEIAPDGLPFAALDVSAGLLASFELRHFFLGIFLEAGHHVFEGGRSFFHGFGTAGMGPFVISGRTGIRPAFP